MSYSQQIEEKKQAAIAELLPDHGHKYVVGKVFSATCINAVGRTTFTVCRNMDAAEGEAINLIGDFDLSRTEWYDPTDTSEYGDPALDAAIAELKKYGRISFGDFDITLDTL